MIKTTDIHVRDPFIFACAKEKKYYLFGTTFADGIADLDPCFEVYVSSDRENWEGPFVAFAPPKDFWGVRHYWAPEVFQIDDAFYMFATCKGGIGHHRGSIILKALHPAGPYVPHSTLPLTPSEWECLDGTYYEDEDKTRWMIFCHEWTTEYSGKIKAMRLTDDLSTHLDDEVFTILNAQDMPWIRHFSDPRVNKHGYLTDAPFMYKTKSGALLMLWSSYSKDGGYTVAVARSISGKITGDWTHDESLLLDNNTGHSSLFRDFRDGSLYLCTHSPDTPHGSERPLFLKIEEKEDRLVFVD